MTEPNATPHDASAPAKHMTETKEMRRVNPPNIDLDTPLVASAPADVNERTPTSNDLLPMWLRDRAKEEHSRLAGFERSYAILRNRTSTYAKGILRMVALQRAVCALIDSANTEHNNASR